jgi:AcrR family transcriptional regulator
MSLKERRARHHAAIEKRILETAEELLLRSGLDGVSLRAVAERIEYSPAAIYGYFPTKDDLLAALAAHGFRQLNDALTRVSELTDSSPLARLREFYWRYYEFSKTHAAYYELMFLDSSYPQHRWDREALEFLRAATASADRLIAGFVDTGTTLSETSTAAVRRTLWAAVHGAAAIALRKRLPADTDCDQLAADTLDAVLAGYSRSAPCFSQATDDRSKSKTGGHNVDLVSDPNRTGNRRSIHRGHQTRQHVKGDGAASSSVMAMSHRTIERVIGRLLTDEELRLKFTRSPRQTVAELSEQGWELSHLEVDALLATEIRLWSDVAPRIDPRLQRCCLKTQDDETS